MNPTPEPIDVAEVCRRTGASRDVVYDLIHSGKLRARVKVPGAKRPTYVVEVADWEAYWNGPAVVAVAGKVARPRRLKIVHEYV